MSRYERSIPTAYFDTLYATDPDPWRFAVSDYERDKYRATLESLPRSHYAHGLEVGCSIGVLTRQLATRCDRLLALDVAEAALAHARALCADATHVDFEQRRVPDEWTPGRFDLILLSEVVYYLDRDDVRRLAERVDAAAMPGADILLVHWLGDTHYPLTGDDAAECFIECSSAKCVGGRREEAYRLDVLKAAEAGPT